MVNINDISKETGFSKSTISRYLNNGSVSKKTGEKIKKAIDKLGFVPNRYARSLKLSKTDTIAVIIPNFTGYTKNIALESINLYLKEKNFTMILSCSNDNMDYELEILNNVLKLNVDGILLFASDITEKHKEFFNKSRVPILIYGQSLEGQYCVRADDYLAGKKMGEYISKLNHKEITFFDIADYDKSVSERFLGLSDVLKKTNVKINHHIVDFSKESGYLKMKEVFNKEEATFYVGATDNIALGILKALREFNVNIPEEISVSGFGNYEISSMITPSLTTVEFSYRDLGLTSVKRLIQLIENEKLEKEKLLDCEIVIRESTK